MRQSLHGHVDPGSPHVLVAIEGSGVVESHGMESISFAKGEAVVVPAAVSEYVVRPQWELELMRMSVPTGSVAVPETTLQEFVAAR
jgi:mannose-6-phosphate isomerase class I